MKGKRNLKYVAFLFLIVYAIFPWVAPAYNHLVLSVRFAAGSVPTYDVLLQNQGLWPVTFTYAQWLVTHGGIYNYWSPSEAPIQDFTLLPSGSHSFQFTIYNATSTMTREYFNGTLTVELRATIDVFGAVSHVRVTAAYNATGSQ